MSDEYTPTTEVVKDAACWQRRRLGEPRGVDPESFDRWLDKVKAEAQVDALEDVATAHFLDGPQSTYETLMHRADRIAREAGIESKGARR